MKRTMIQRMGKSTAALLLAAAVSVGFLQGAMTQPVSAEAAELSDFEAVFDAYSTKRNVWDDFFNWPKPEPVAAADFTKYWTVNADGMLESTGGGKLNLLYTKEKYTDFTMTFRYKHGPDEKGAAHLYVGIGAPESGATLGTKGELLAPSPTLLRIYQVGNYQYAPKPNGEDGWYGPGNLFNDETAKNAVHTVTISVTGSTMTMKVDGRSLGALALTNYEGGHIFFGAGMTVDAIGLPEITTPTNDFDGFSSYYSENITSGDENAQDLQKVSPTDYWTEDNGKIVRRNVLHSTDATDNLYIASLFYNAQEYQNFELEVDVTAGTNYWRRAFIGFGADMGKHYQQAGGGIAVFMDNGANGVWLNQCGNLGNDDGNFSRDGWGNFYEGLSLNDTQHLRLVMRDRILSVYVNEDPTPTKFLMPDWYDGGYIYFASNSTGASFANIKIKEIPGGAPAGSQNSHLYEKGALFIGDSISYGAEDTPKGYAWAGRIGFNYAMDWINASRGGATVARHPDSGIPQISDQLDYGYVGGRTIDYVIIEGGINDALRHQENEAACPLGAISESTDPEDFDQNTFAGALESLLCEIKERYPGAKIGYITTYQCPGWISVDKSGDYMELAKVICDKWGVPYLDLHENAELNAQLADCLPDKLHMNAAGYEIVTPLIEEFMLQISHTYDQKNTHAQYLKSKATCAKKAVYYYSCVCGKAGESTFESGETLPHTPAEKWSSDDNGHWHACTACGTKVDEAAHNPGAAATEDTPQTCTVCGYELAPATGHVNHVADTSKWLHDGTQHWHKCQRCDEKMDAAAHSGGEATCEEKAECAVCGVEYGELADHSYEDWVIVREATETANGLKERTCTVCGEKESEEIPATGETPDTNPEPGDKIPQTGENVPWIVLATAILASVVSVGSLLIQRKRKQKGI